MRASFLSYFTLLSQTGTNRFSFSNFFFKVFDSHAVSKRTTFLNNLLDQQRLTIVNGRSSWKLIVVQYSSTKKKNAKIVVSCLRGVDLRIRNFKSYILRVPLASILSSTCESPAKLLDFLVDSFFKRAIFTHDPYINYNTCRY